MPRAWSRKDERQYQHIKSSCLLTKRQKGRTTKDCKRIAASTVNAQRRREGRTLSLGPVEWAMRERVALARKCNAYMREEGKVCANPIGIALGSLAALVVGMAAAYKLGGSSRETAPPIEGRGSPVRGGCTSVGGGINPNCL